MGVSTDSPLTPDKPPRLRDVVIGMLANGIPPRHTWTPKFPISEIAKLFHLSIPHVREIVRNERLRVESAEQRAFDDAENAEDCL